LNRYAIEKKNQKSSTHKNLNICLLTASFLPKVGGLEMAVHNLATALTRLGHYVVVVSPRSSKDKTDIPKNYFVYQFGFRGSNRLQLTSLLAVSTLFYVVKKFRIDVIHVHDVYAPGKWIRYFRAFVKNIPVIGTPHGDDIQCLPTLKYGRRLYPKIDKAIRRNVKSFTLLTAISQSVRSELMEILGDSAIIRSIPNGIWTSRFERNANRIKVREQYGIPIDSIALISVGRNVPVKGFEFGLRAVAKVVSQGHRISYVLVGRDMSSIVNKACEYGIADYVFTPGQLPADQVSDLYLASDIYINTSLMESFGITTLEAMCAGLPCVVTDVPGNKDIVSTEYGLLVSHTSEEALINAICFLLDNPACRRSLGNKAHFVALNYDWLKIAGSYVDAYEEAIVGFSRLS